MPWRIWDAASVLVLGPRSVGKKAARLSARTRSAAVCQRTEKPAAGSRCAAQTSIHSVDEYLTYQYVPHPRTIFRGYQKAAAGSLRGVARRPITDRLLLAARLETRNPPARGAISGRSARAAHQRRRLRMRSDVPLGAFLSGGIDSSIIVALMQQLSAAAGQDLFDRLSGRRVRRNELCPRGGQASGDRPSRVPGRTRRRRTCSIGWSGITTSRFADSSAIPTYYVSELTREHVTVRLTGDGGDELFAGYTRYRAVRLASGSIRCPAPLAKIHRGQVLAATADRPERRTLVPALQAVVGVGRIPAEALSRLDVDLRRGRPRRALQRRIRGRAAGSRSGRVLLGAFARPRGAMR